MYDHWERQSQKCIQVLLLCLDLLRKRETLLTRWVLQVLLEGIPVSNECPFPEHKALLLGLLTGVFHCRSYGLRKHFSIFTFWKTIGKPQFMAVSTGQTCLCWGENNCRVTFITSLHGVGIILQDSQNSQSSDIRMSESKAGQNWPDTLSTSPALFVLYLSSRSWQAIGSIK